jgi:hypothetical protein
MAGSTKTRKSAWRKMVTKENMSERNRKLMGEMQIIMLVVNSGNARSLALEALTDAKDGKFEDAEAKLAEPEEKENFL